jgi:hypothetical protein
MKHLLTGIELLKVSETVPLKCKIWPYALATLMKSSSKQGTTIFKQKLEYDIKQFSYLDARRNNLNQKH